VNKKLEEARASKAIGQSLEALAEIGAGRTLYDFLKAREAMLPDLMIVSAVELKEAGALSVVVRKAPGRKCARCWKYTVPDGKEPADICPRCRGVVERCHGL
jgi:isoleucyl-tRNA synthetase